MRIWIVQFRLLLFFVIPGDDAPPQELLNAFGKLKSIWNGPAYIPVSLIISDYRLKSTLLQTFVLIIFSDFL